MSPYYEQDGIAIYCADCRDVLPQLGPVDHVITDPPYARDVYLRLTQPHTHNGSETFKRLSVPAVGKQGRKIHDLKDGALARRPCVLPLHEVTEPQAQAIDFGGEVA